jgi:serine O-acetyltransferase
LSNFHHDYKAFDRNSGKFGFLKLFFLSPGFRAILLYRSQSFLFSKNRLVLSYALYSINFHLHGFDALPGSKIGHGLRIEHPSGIVIGSGVVIGDNCTILQGVTLGVKYVDKTRNVNRYPIIGNNVILGAKASLLGQVSIGDRSVVGAHSLVLDTFPADSTIMGNPARQKKRT